MATRERRCQHFVVQYIFPEGQDMASMLTVVGTLTEKFGYMNIRQCCYRLDFYASVFQLHLRLCINRAVTLSYVHGKFGLYGFAVRVDYGDATTNYRLFQPLDPASIYAAGPWYFPRPSHTALREAVHVYATRFDELPVNLQWFESAPASAYEYDQANAVVLDAIKHRIPATIAGGASLREVEMDRGHIRCIRYETAQGHTVCVTDSLFGPQFADLALFFCRTTKFTY